MSKRDRSHEISDKALHRIKVIFADCGWACEEIRRDYGEDILVQTKLPPDVPGDGRVDFFKTYVQARGKEDVKPLRDGRWSLSIKRKHLLRWLNIREPLLIVVWDLETDSGRYCLPARQRTLAEVLVTRSDSFTVHLPPTAALEVERLQPLSWALRVESYAEAAILTAARIQEMLYYAKESGKDTVNDPPIQTARKNLDALLDIFLTDIGLLARGAVDASVTQRLEEIRAGGYWLDRSESEHPLLVCEERIYQVVQERSGEGLFPHFASMAAYRLEEHLPPTRP